MTAATPLALSDHPPALDALRALLDARHSCRAFKPDPVPRALVTALLETAQRTASWCNAQPWQVAVLEREATERLRTRLHAHASSGAPTQPDFQWPREYQGEYLQRRRACGLQLYAAVGVTREDKAGAVRQGLRNFSFFDAPHVALISSNEALGVYGAVDCGAYVANFLLAAQACGLGAIPQAAVASYADFVKEAVGIPMERKLVCAISFGYEDTAHASNGFRTERAGLDEVVRWVA